MKLLILLIFYCFLNPLSLAAQDLKQRLTEIAARFQAGTVGIAVVDNQNGQSVFEYQARDALMPASIMKVVTSGLVLERFGPEYVFKTQVWGQAELGSKIKKVSIVGAGDPDLTIESLWLLLRRFKRLGIRQIDQLLLDDSRFVSQHQRLGQRAYQTGASALAFNFNSVGFEVCPNTHGQTARVHIEPLEAGYKLVGKIITSSDTAYSIDELTPHSYKLSGKIAQQANCMMTYRSVTEPLQYLADTIKNLASSLGLSIIQVGRGQPEKTSNLMFVHSSKPLKQILLGMNHYSNNFVAEQLLYLLGEDEFGNMDRKLGLKHIEQYLLDMGIKASEFSIYDGSGLSRDNRLSAYAVAKVFARLASNEKLASEFITSMSVSGRSGTMRDRDFKYGTFVRGKTGTLNGVSSLAGLVNSGRSRQYSFSVIYNGDASKSSVAKLENNLVEALYTY